MKCAVPGCQNDATSGHKNCPIHILKEPSSVISLVQKNGDQRVIDCLERMLERARLGEISGVVVVAHTPSGIANDWGGVWRASEIHWAFKVLVHQMVEAGTTDGKTVIE